jgi:hypothetical protein
LSDKVLSEPREVVLVPDQLCAIDLKDHKHSTELRQCWLGEFLHHPLPEAGEVFLLDWVVDGVGTAHVQRAVFIMLRPHFGRPEGPGGWEMLQGSGRHYFPKRRENHLINPEGMLGLGQIRLSGVWHPWECNIHPQMLVMEALGKPNMSALMEPSAMEPYMDGLIEILHGFRII